MNLSEIFLPSAAFKVLSKISGSPLLEPIDSTNRDILSSLSDLGLIEYAAGALHGKAGYVISAKGLAYLSFHQDRDRQRKISNRRYWITTSIALFALALSAISILMQIFKWA